MEMGKNHDTFLIEHHRGNIFLCLRKGMWGAKIDLKHAYFHLGLSNTLKEYVVLKVGEKYYQFQGAAFGLSTLPQIWMMAMKTFSKLWRRRGNLCFIYLHVILVINNTPGGLEKDLEYTLHSLSEAGMVVILPNPFWSLCKF